MDNITIAGETYPVRLTMGAIREYKNLTGKELDQVQGISEIGECLYACVVSTCRQQKKEFALSLEEFTDNLEVATATAVFTNVMSAQGLSVDEPGNAKKKQPKSK